MHVCEETSDHYRELYHFELALYPRLEWRDDVGRVGGLANAIEEVEGGYYMLIEVHAVLALLNLKHLALVFSPIKKWLDEDSRAIVKNRARLRFEPAYNCLLTPKGLRAQKRKEGYREIKRVPRGLKP